MEFKHDLPDGITDWVAKTGKGEITRLERHVARREAWVVDVTRPDGSVLEGFLRLERERRPRDPWSLAKETKIIEALGTTSVPVTPLDHGIRDVLKRAAKSVGVDAPLMVSGAGHDAQMPALSGVPTGMIFVRSTGGSHTPREFASNEDAALGAQALAAAIKELAT